MLPIFVVQPKTPMCSSRGARRPTPTTWLSRASCRRPWTLSPQGPGGSYRLVEYEGAPDAERVLVLMGSGVGAAHEAVDALVKQGERVGVATVRLYRPFPAEQLVAALPPSVRSIAVLDRTKEPGAVGEPLYLDVRAALDEAMDSSEPPFSARASGYRGTLRFVVQGVHPGDGQGCAG